VFVGSIVVMSKHTPGPWIVERNGITVKQSGKYAQKICRSRRSRAMTNTPWIVRFYIASRFGSMTERRFVFDAELRREHVIKLADQKLAGFRRNNIAVYPRYDLEKKATA
jgi:hypothetical protein